MPEIIPAIMPETPDELSLALSLVKGLVSYAQIDVMDGIFVDNKSWPYSAWQEFQTLLKEEGELPYWQDINYEFDLMVKDPAQILDGLISLGATRIIFHIESVDEDRLRTIIEKAKESDIEVGLALNNDTSLEKLSPFIDTINFAQLMGIARIGFQGERFDERVIGRIKKLREMYPSLIISVDGGVNFETAPKLVLAGANRLVSGSAIFESGDVDEAIKTLSSLTS